MKSKSIRGKYALLIVLAFLALLVISRSAMNEQSLKRLQGSFTEMYRDRLMTESYIYQLNDLLYQKKILLAGDGLAPAEKHRRASGQTEAIRELIRRYAATKLTEEERSLFEGFKAHAALLAAGEQALMKQGQMPAAGAAVIAQCDLCLGGLQSLSALQVREGKLLTDQGNRLLSGTIMTFQLEWVAYIVLLLVVLSLLKKKRLISKISQPYSMN